MGRKVSRHRDRRSAGARGMSAESMMSAFANAQPVERLWSYGCAGADVDALVRKRSPLVRRIAWHVHGRIPGACDAEGLVQIASLRRLA